MGINRCCKTCEFNSDGICAGHGDTYKYGEAITDDSRTCEDWGASFDYYSQITVNAPRFLREQLNDCRISYETFEYQYDDFLSDRSVPLNFFDAIKYIYGISMVDIAVLLNVSFGVVYRAKTQGIPGKRVKQFTDELLVNPEWLKKVTTSDFSRLSESRAALFAQPNIESRIAAIPEWKQKLIDKICSKAYLSCPVHLAREFARVDKLFWTNDMPLDDFTAPERALVKYVSAHPSEPGRVVRIDYSLDMACTPHLNCAVVSE